MKDLNAYTATIVAGWLSNPNNSVPIAAIPEVIDTVLTHLEGYLDEVPVVVQHPFVPVDQSIDPNGDYIVCLEDGKKFKSMRRHLLAAYGMSPEDYRAKWNLPDDYPMVAPNYSAVRSAQAKIQGLGK